MQSQCWRIPGTRYALAGPLAAYVEGVGAQWLKVAPQANPAMLDIFADRDRKPYRNLVPWAGEFAGKYLTSAVQILRLSGDDSLRALLGKFVGELLAHQDADGYLGPWPQRHRLTGRAPNVMGKMGGTWDAWGHYHAALGLLLWYGESGEERALQGAARIGDLLCRKFLGRQRRRLVDTGSTEMNLAPVHALCLLYRETGLQEYLDLALQGVEEFAAEDGEGNPLAGDYLRQALAGRDFYQFPRPRWESLHPIMGLAELHWITGEQKYREACERIWWSICRLDRHNNGGFSSGEQAQGDPYHPGAIETCCTVAWMALSAEMLKLTGESLVADELELSTLNSGLGLHSPTGRWVTYNTPMDGVRRASAHDIVFQAREGSPELNCCSVNGPRALGLVSEWALMGDGEGLLLNWYGAGSMEADIGGTRVELVQETEYPRRGRVAIEVRPSRPLSLALKVRLPHWSERVRLRVNGQPVRGVRAGSYARLERRWRRGDRIELELDMRLHYWAGEGACQGRTSIFRGPVLLAWDRRLNQGDEAPALQAEKLAGRLAKAPQTMVVLDVAATDGGKVRLCDFASAGHGGSPYRSWLEVGSPPAAPFSRENPLRSARP